MSTRTMPARAARRLLLGTLLGALVALMAFAWPASAAKRDRCARADARLAATGKGDPDGDGVSSCRERRVLGSSPVDADSDDDGLDDGQEDASRCDATDPDSDDDGIPDGEDDSPAPPPEQKLEALLDALACPTPEAAGSISALGTTAVVDASTEFEDASCEDLAALLAAGETLFVEVKILEDEAGGLLAIEVELEDDEHDDHGDDDDDDAEDDDEDEGEDEDQDDDS